MQSLSDEGVFESKTTYATVVQSLARENSDSSRGSHKRKSFEENDENSPANTLPEVTEPVANVAKKGRTTESSTTGSKTSKLPMSSSSSRSKTQSGSAYAPAVSASTPNRNNTNNNTSKTPTTNNNSNNSATPLFASPHTRAATKKAAVMSANRAVLSDVLASPSVKSSMSSVPSSVVSSSVVPSSGISVSATPRRTQTSERAMPTHINSTNNSNALTTVPETPRITNNALVRKVEKDLVDVLTGDASSLILDKYVSVSALQEKVQQVMASLQPPTHNNNSNSRSKSKFGTTSNTSASTTGTTVKSWDLKSTLKKHEQAVKDLQEIVSSVKTGLSQAREGLGVFESRIAHSVVDVHAHLVEDAQLIAMLQRNDKSMRKEIDNLQVELRAETAKLTQFQSQSLSALRTEQANLTIKEAEISRLNEKLCDLELQLSRLQKTHEDHLNEVKQSQSKHSDEVGKVYQLEIAHLQANQKRLENDLDRNTREHDELMKKNMQLMEELQQVKSVSKEGEVNTVMLDREVQRLTAECVVLRETVSKKDEDLRVQMQNAFDLQKNSLEEKANMRDERNAMERRMQSVEEDRRILSATTAQLKEANLGLQKEIDNLTSLKSQLESQLAQREIEVVQGREAVMQCELESRLRVSAENRYENEHREVTALTAQTMAITAECTKKVQESEEKLRIVEHESKLRIDELTIALNEAQQRERHTSDEVLGLREEVTQLHTAMQSSDHMTHREHIEELGRCKGELEVLKQRFLDLTQTYERQTVNDNKRFAEYEDKLLTSETLRRKLHNQVQELRGNIRVFARVRPFLPNDGYEMSNLPDASILVRPELNSLKIARSVESSVGGTSAKREDFDFGFDRVFGQSSSQESLFEEVAEFVQSALDGYHVCLFSYGQTGSGKTHTMNGSGEGSMRGIIPRAMEQVGIYKQQLQEKGWEYYMEVSFLEIYNETIRDLLRSSNDNNNNNNKHEIKKDIHGNVTVTDLTRIVVDPSNFTQIMQIMDMASQQRSVTCTQMNDRSSRSHAVFTLYLKACNASQGIELNGALNLVDLAGSERVDRSGVTGNDLKETVAINKSLSALADVFSALANKQAHVPYRNSKLTYLLQPALSGDGKTLMIVNLSPTEASYFESLSSLRFANQVSQCELGKPKRRLKDVSAESNNNNKLNASMSKDNYEESTTTTLNTSVITNTPSKKLTLTWEGSNTTSNATSGRTQGTSNTTSLSASLGSKRPLADTSSSSKVVRSTTASTSAPSASGVSTKRSALLSSTSSSRVATTSSRTPAKK